MVHVRRPHSAMWLGQEERSIKVLRYFVLILALTAITAHAADWPMHRADAGRSGGSADALPDSPKLLWKWQAPHRPSPAWPTEPRMLFDSAYHPVIAGGILYVASNADDQLRALDAVTGKLLWTSFADAPIRFAPAVAEGRLYVGSDDGYLRCLDAKTGKPIWSKRGGPSDAKVMGNGRVVSRWPVRGGPVVHEGIVYFAAGFWPSDGVYLYAVDAATGKTIWCNDKAGEIDMLAKGETGASFQGYLVAGPRTIIAPNGRVAPSLYERATGKYIDTVQRINSHACKTTAIIDGIAYSSNGRECNAYTAEKMLPARGAGGGAFVAANAKMVFALDRKDADEILGYVRDGDSHTVEGRDRKGETVAMPTVGELVFKARTRKVTTEMIAAANTVVASSGNVVFGVKITSGSGNWEKEAWSLEVDGNALALAVADGRLYVSTDTGMVYCFGDAKGSVASSSAAPVTPAVDKAYASAAADIVKLGGVTRGLCIDLGCGEGQLALALAKRTDLRIYGVTPDPQACVAIRWRLSEAGLYGTRVTVHLGDPDKPAELGLDGYADLVVSSRALAGKAPPLAAMRDLSCPYRGVICIIEPNESWAPRRDPVMGADNWTHFYATAGNRFCSDDTVVRGPLRMRWYRDVVIPVPSRHGRAQPPLVYNGLMIIAGLDGVAAVNAFNGETIWQYAIPGLMAAHNNGYIPGGAAGNSVMCVGDGRFFVKAEDKCLMLDVNTGKLLRTFSLPDGADGPWGYLAYDDGVVVGSIADETHAVHGYSKEFPVNRLLTESHTLFAINAKSGRPLWTHKADDSVKHMAVGLGGGGVYFIDRAMHEYESSAGAKRHDAYITESRRRGEDKGVARRKLSDQHKPGRLVGLDLRTGKVRWKTDANIRGLMVLVSDKHERVYTAGHSVYPMRASAGETVAHDIVTGKPLWRAGSPQRLWLNGDVLVVGGPVDAVTGKPAKLPHDKPGAEARAARGGRRARSGGRHCGIGSHSRYLGAYRSGELGYSDSGVRYVYGGVRSGCWTTNIPANGLLLQSDSGYGCGCGYPIQASFGLEPIPGRGHGETQRE